MSEARVDPIERHRQYWPETYDELLMPLAMALHRAHEEHRKRADAVLDKYGLAPAEFDVLATLRRSPEPYALTPSEIQQGLFITSGGLTKVLQQLEAKGLVGRSTSEADRRSKPVHLSPVAIGLIENVMADLIAATEAPIKEMMSEAEIRELTRLLNRFQPACGDPAGGPRPLVR